MSYVPPVQADFSHQDWLGSQDGNPNFTAVVPLILNPATHVLTVRTATDAQSGVVSIAAQSFAGVKTFASLPECSAAVSTAAQLVNKTYVDSLFQHGISWQQPVEMFWDFASGDPAGLADGLRYIASATSGAFDSQNIYVRSGATYIEIVPEEGWCLYDRATDLNYIFTQAGTWDEMGISLRHSDLIGLTIGDSHTQYLSVVGRAGQGLMLRNIGVIDTATIDCVDVSGDMSFDMSAATSSYVFSGTQHPVSVQCTNASTSTTTGALLVAGGIGCSGRAFADGFRSVTTGSGAIGFQSLTPALAHGEVHIGLLYGKTYGSNLNCAQALYYHDADGSSFNYMYFALWGGSLVKIFNNRLRVEATTASTTITSGALEVMGGIGCSGQIYAVGVRSVTTGNASIGFQSLVPGISAGQYHIGLQIGKQDAVANDSGQMLWFHTGDGSAANYMYLAIWGGSLFKFFNNRMAIEATTASTSLTTGALTVAGGLGVSGSIFSGNITVLTANGTLSLENNQAGASRRTCYMQWDQGNSRCAIGTWNGATSGADYPVHIIPTIPATSAATGALVVAGGCGIALDLWVGGTIHWTPTPLSTGGAWASCSGGNYNSIKSKLVGNLATFQSAEWNTTLSATVTHIDLNTQLPTGAIPPAEFSHMIDIYHDGLEYCATLVINTSGYVFIYSIPGIATFTSGKGLIVRGINFCYTVT